MKIKITDIAQQAKVSPATVSRIINGNCGVSREKRDAVLQAFENLHYLPKKARSGMMAPKTIGILFFSDFYSDSSVIMRKFRQMLKALPQDWQLRLFPLEVSPLFLASLYRKGLLSGIIVVGHNSGDPDFDDLLENIPAIFLNSHNLKGKSVILNGNDAAGKLAAQYLMEKKCKNLLVIQVPSRNPGVQARIDGFRFSCFCENRTYSQCKITLGNENEAMEIISNAQLEQYLETALNDCKLKIYDGIFVPEARLMALTCRYFLKHGIKQPIMVACNTGEEYFAAFYPRPACVNLGESTMGTLAIEQLIQKINHPESFQTSMLIDPVLIPGDL